MSNINWTGNKVLDPGSTRQQSTPQTSRTPTQSAAPPSTPPASPQLSPFSYMPSVGQAAGGYTPPALVQAPADPPGTMEGPPPATERGFIPYYLSGNIGRNVRCEFIIGTNQYVDKTGVLSEVGINYFVLRDINSRADIMCDLYSVKFVTILRS